MVHNKRAIEASARSLLAWPVAIISGQARDSDEERATEWIKIEFDHLKRDLYIGPLLENVFKKPLEQVPNLDPATYEDILDIANCVPRELIELGHKRFYSAVASTLLDRSSELFAEEFRGLGLFYL
ncbi:hypothetical protein BX616_000544 [Lobosporangium transversale]|uniref:Uncharacterized protein n=1 Tax=Lobosporangium transversale TaxID=64571 RepID=A0A1Y2GDI2_9FUNG|nr:hypothetical protein BCR41DRAFT_373521 [Lobosporangium transversale]KAF9907026.1 hypothetical protein BX616_000544 [Lobosporangium transversale]ORZ07767.1 hypothetical protein BCR41DRAFT_373521 [Lobosporangium transversale]|eukprot:XP_021878133.1 hypothetical protein BCR41DRAFT_373521 [Lobosporangium transversale]